MKITLLCVMAVILTVVADCVSAQKSVNDSLAAELVAGDTINDVFKVEDSLLERNDVPVAKSEVDHQRQVWLGIGMMAFVALVISSSQSWNPR